MTEGNSEKIATAPDPTPESLTPDPDTGALREAQARRVRLRRILALAALASTVVLGGIGWWTHLQVEESMRATRGAALKSVLDSEAKSLGVWIDDQKLGVRRLAGDRRLRELVGVITAAAEETSAGSSDACGASSPRDSRSRCATTALAATAT